MVLKQFKRYHPEYRMPKELKEKWITALRSGNYGQAKQVMYDKWLSEDGKPFMCCLGVLEHICGTPVEDMEDSDNIVFPKDVETPRSPEEFLIDATPVGEHPIAHILAWMNDGYEHKAIKRHSFAEIADWIDENL